MSPLEKLRQIVNDAKGTDLERVKIRLKHSNPLFRESIRQDVEFHRLKRAEWEAASDLLDEMLATSKGRRAMSEHLDHNVIRFYRASDKPYGCFSNLFRRDMIFGGETFPTAEHAYQAGKARKPEVRAWLLAAPSPSLVAMAAHGLYSWDIVPGWSKDRYERMRRVVLAKFTQHLDLAKILIDTGDHYIAESTSTDNPVNRRWGEVQKGDQWIGENWLGKLLMETREHLRATVAIGDSGRPTLRAER